MPRKVHRGRGKEVATCVIQIRLTPEEVELLDQIAETNLRSRTAHATWAVLQEIRRQEFAEYREARQKG